MCIMRPSVNFVLLLANIDWFRWTHIITVRREARWDIEVKMQKIEKLQD